jgi:hypothetical protein
VSELAQNAASPRGVPGRIAAVDWSGMSGEAGVRGVHRVNMRHGVSRVRAGRRHTLGVIFHDAT